MGDPLEKKGRRKSKTMQDDFDDSKIFPQRLMEVLDDDANSDAITWLPHGRAFLIRDRLAFEEKVMPRFFPRKAKYSSFTRKLNRWNFVRVSSGPEIGSWYHEFFLRAKPHLAAQMFCKNARAKLAMANDLPAPQILEQSPLTTPSELSSLFDPIEFPREMPSSPPLASQPNLMAPALCTASAKDNGMGKEELYSMAYGTTNMMMLEQQIQQMQQEQARRLMMDRLVGSRLYHQEAAIPHVTSPNEMQAAQLWQMRELMSFGQRQRQAGSPYNGRASAA
jgi:hypothetical protein